MTDFEKAEGNLKSFQAERVGLEPTTESSAKERLLMDAYDSECEKAAALLPVPVDAWALDNPI